MRVLLIHNQYRSARQAEITASSSEGEHLES